MRLSRFSLPVEYLSASSLTKAASCPEAWRRRYILKEHERVFPSMFLGTVTHSMIEQNLFQKMMSGTDMPVEWVRSSYRPTWDTLEAKEEPVWDNENQEEMVETGLKMAEMYHETVAPTIVPVLVEDRFEENIPGVPLPIVGYMDVVTSDRIIDVKTSKSKVTKAKPGWRFQARVYQLVADLGTEWHVVTTQKEPRIYTAETEPGLFLNRGNPDSVVRLIQQIAHRLNDLYERFGPDEPWPTEGVFHPWLCDRCHAKNDGCPAWIVGDVK